MEISLSVRIGADGAAVERRVRSPWGGFRRGSVVEVQIVAADDLPRWLSCRVDRWMTGHLWVTEIS